MFSLCPIVIDSGVVISHSNHLENFESARSSALRGGDLHLAAMADKLTVVLMKSLLRDRELRANSMILWWQSDGASAVPRPAAGKNKSWSWHIPSPFSTLRTARLLVNIRPLRTKHTESQTSSPSRGRHLIITMSSPA